MKASHCNFCGRDVYNRCIHQSQVKFCNQRSVMSASEIYGSYETSKNGVIVEKGIGPIDVIIPGVFTEEFVSFTSGSTTTKVRLSTISL